MANKAIKVGIIGYGYMGEIRRRVLEENDSFQLIGICDPKPLNLGKGNPYKIWKSPHEVIQEDLDAVFVCTPNSLSPDIVINSLESGKHVFCEKPPGRTVEDIENMRKAEQKSGLKLMFGFNHRLHPGILEAKQIVDSGRFGKILFIRGIYGKSGGVNYLKSWRNDINISGGGILIDQGIHMLDLFRYFIGDFDEIKSFITTAYWGTVGEDNAFVILRSSKQTAMLHSSATLWKHTFKIEIFLDDAYLIVSGLLSKTGSYGRETLTIGRRQFEDETRALGNPREEIIYFDEDKSWELEVSYFADAIINDNPIQNGTSLDALKAMQLVEAIYKDDGITYVR
jgi:predicted dehydrogenase